MICGTAGYMAPEVINGKGYSLKSDIFSVGSILFGMLSNGSLFPRIDDNDTMLILNQVCELPDLDTKLKQAKASQAARDIVKNMLSKDPSKRPSAFMCLNHPWFLPYFEAIQHSINLNKAVTQRRDDGSKRQI